MEITKLIPLSLLFDHGPFSSQERYLQYSLVVNLYYNYMAITTWP